MTLEEIVETIDSVARETVICLRPPWTPSSESLLSAPERNFDIPTHVKASGFEYFIDVATALEVFEVFEDRARKPTSNEKARLLIHYATEDAYPDWVYED